MNRFLRTAIYAAGLISCTAFAADPTTTAATPANPNPTATNPVSMTAKMFTKDQLASALQNVVDKINACNGDTRCLKGAKEWNEAAMANVKNLAVNFKQGQTLQIELICKGSKAPQISSQTVALDANSAFTVTPPAERCMVKGVEPKCGAIERGKHYPDLKAGEILYCVTGDDAKLKQTTDNLKEAVMNSMKKAMQNNMQQKAATPAAGS